MYFGNGAASVKIDHLGGVQICYRNPHKDERGIFSRVAELEDFENISSAVSIKQVSYSSNDSALTLRGLHAMNLEVNEYKIVSCVTGTLLDVVVDVREESPTFLDYMQIILNSSEGKSVIIPPGFAHGYLTLAPNTSLIYCMTASYCKNEEIGFRWDDDAIGIDWGIDFPNSISKRDLGFSLINDR